MGSPSIEHSVFIVSCLNVKALVGAFKQEMALVGAFSMIVKLQNSRLIRFQLYAVLCSLRSARKPLHYRSSLSSSI